MRNVKHNEKLISRMATITFVLLIIETVLADIFRLGSETGRDSFSGLVDLYVPYALYYYMWYAVLVLIGLYISFQYAFNSRRPDNNDRVVRRVSSYLVVFNAASMLWVIARHFENATASKIIVLVMAATIVLIRGTISNRSSLSRRENLYMKIPFSVIFTLIIILLGSIIAVDFENNMFIVVAIGAITLFYTLVYKDVYIGAPTLIMLVLIRINLSGVSTVEGLKWSIVLLAVIHVFAMVWIRLNEKNKNRRRRSIR